MRQPPKIEVGYHEHYPPGIPVGRAFIGFVFWSGVIFGVVALIGAMSS